MPMPRTHVTTFFCSQALPRNTFTHPGGESSTLGVCTIKSASTCNELRDIVSAGSAIFMQFITFLAVMRESQMKVRAQSLRILVHCTTTIVACNNMSWDFWELGIETDFVCAAECHYAFCS